MKGSWNWKKFLALFMAVAMVMASGVFVTTQSFQATDDESYGQEESTDMNSVDIEGDEGEADSGDTGDGSEGVTEEQQVNLEETAGEEGTQEGEPADGAQGVDGELSDIVVYDQDVKPFIIVECKKETVPLTQKVLDQACRYNLVLQVPYLCLTNGAQQICCQVDFAEKRLISIPELPKYHKRC